MKTKCSQRLQFSAPVAIVLLTLFSASAADSEKLSPQQIFSNAVFRVTNLIEPQTNTAPQAFSGTVKITKAVGIPSQLANRSAHLLFQAPDRLALKVSFDNKTYAAARNGQQVWAYLPDKNWGVLGQSGVPRFGGSTKLDSTKLPPFSLPGPLASLHFYALLAEMEALPSEKIDGEPCQLIKIRPKEQLQKLMGLPNFELTTAIREKDFLFARIAFDDLRRTQVEIQFSNLSLEPAAPATRWAIPSREGDKIETVALSHLLRFFPVAYSTFTQRIPTLSPATGNRQVVATEGQGRYEKIDGTRVLFLQGTPEEMGHQQGILLKRHVRNLVDRVLYGVGVGSSFEKARWFFTEIESAQARLKPFIDPRYLREMDAMAAASGVEPEELRLANFFPELFHCSGFALSGSATKDGHMFHGRILDYLRGMGLEQNAVVMVYRPDVGYAWVNVGYAGFIGSVTAMNEKHIAIGEMGGRGEGNWDGKPMAQLVREVMEKSATLEEAVAIMRKGPRTCEYYYVISDGNSKRAVGIAATPDTFEVIEQGQTHPRLPHAIKDVVLMSAGQRYEKLAERVQANLGKFDAASARELMTRPVAMNSNIHSVLFQPDTLDFWVANADSKNVASHCRYTHYNLADLLKANSSPPRQ